MDEAQVRELIVAAIGDGHHEFGSFFLSRFFGMAVSYEADACIVSLDVKPYMFNPQGSLHGGVLATALDISMGHLLKNQFGAGATLEEFTDIIGRNFRQPEQGLGFDNSPVAHMWRAMIRPAKYL